MDNDLLHLHLKVDWLVVAELEDVCKSFGDKPVVRDFSCRILRGDRIGIIGPNGAGKTTLFNAIQGFRKPAQGSIELLGHSPYPRNLDLLTQIGIQPQRPAFFPHTTLREHLCAVADIADDGVPSADVEAGSHQDREKDSGPDMGAEVIKVEPPGGSSARRIGPFLDQHPDTVAAIIEGLAAAIDAIAADLLSDLGEDGGEAGHADRLGGGRSGQ